MEKVIETKVSDLNSDYELYKLDISPGYRDHSFIIELIYIDKDSNKIILCNPKINVELIVHRTDYKRPDGKVMWDYKTEVESNDTLTNDYLEISNCSYKEHLTCLVKVKSNEKYLLRIYYSTEHYYEYQIENGEARWR